MEKLLRRLRFKKGAPATMADADVFPAAAAVDDLSSWEIVDQSDDDESEDYSFGEEEDGDIRVVESLSSDLSTRGDLIDFTDDRQDLVQGDLVKRESIDERFEFYDYDGDNGGGDDEEEEDGYDEDGYGYDLDDELVPKSVSNRFGRQRLRKLGKRAYPKMYKSKRLSYYYNRPGCVHGKHGLGLKHNINF